MQDIHWIHQERETEQPWALQIFHVYSKRKPINQSLEAVLYSERIAGETHSAAMELDASKDVEDMAQALCSDMGRHLEVTGEDYQQLETALGNIVNR